MFAGFGSVHPTPLLALANAAQVSTDDLEAVMVREEDLVVDSEEAKAAAVTEEEAKVEEPAAVTEEGETEEGALEVATVGEAMAAEAVFSRSSDTQFYC